MKNLECISSGKVDSTETTYKYHMQVQETAGETPVRPPGPLKAALKPPKRRLRQSSGDSGDQTTDGPESPIEPPKESPGNNNLVKQH